VQGLGQPNTQPLTARSLLSVALRCETWHRIEIFLQHVDIDTHVIAALGLLDIQPVTRTENVLRTNIKDATDAQNSASQRNALRQHNGVDFSDTGLAANKTAALVIKSLFILPFVQVLPARLHSRDIECKCASHRNCSRRCKEYLLEQNEARVVDVLATERKVHVC
jgi:hypothetical protein